MIPQDVYNIAIKPNAKKSVLAKLPLIQELSSHPDYEKTSIGLSFPLLNDPDVIHSFGKRGTMFGRDIHSVCFWNNKEKRLIGAVYFPGECEGPPNRVHGGCLATAFDALFGLYTLRLIGLGCFTLNLNVTYRHFVPLRGCVRFEIEAEKIEGRKISMRGTFTNNVYSIQPLDNASSQTQILHNEATALFIRLKDSHISYEKAVELFGPNSALSKQDVIQLFKDLKKRRKREQMENVSDDFIPSKL